MSLPKVAITSGVPGGAVSLLVALAAASPAAAQVPSPAIDVCSGVSVNLPTLTQVPAVGAGVIGTLPILGGIGLTLNGAPITNALNGVVTNVNTNIINQLSGQPLSVSVLDANTGNLISAPSSNCSVAVNSPNGITLGGGRINGLGGTGNPQASAGSASAVAIGNGATTAAGVANAVAFGAGANASAAGGVALGSGSVANRLNSAGELFSGTALRTTLGTVSVGSASNERQITNVAGGTADTDAVNVRQLRTVGTNLATSLGGGAGFDPGTGAYTAPSYAVAGSVYRDVGSAIGALDATGVRYDIDPGTGGRSNTITLAGGDPNTPVLIRNVARGIAPTDAANVGQVREAVQEANNYTDARIANSLGNVQSLAQLQQDVRQVRREARQAAAIGLAASSLRFDGTPGKVSLAAGGGAWQGEAGAAFGIGYTSLDGRARMNVSATTADGKWGVGGGLSVTLN